MIGEFFDPTDRWLCDELAHNPATVARSHANHENNTPSARMSPPIPRGLHPELYDVAPFGAPGHHAITCESWG
jgi:hypothetical protein